MKGAEYNNDYSALDVPFYWKPLEIFHHLMTMQDAIGDATQNSDHISSREVIREWTRVIDIVVG